MDGMYYCLKLDGGGGWALSFFFSSRRRHTRFDCDWSSDVCSSDLVGDSTIALTDLPRMAGAGLLLAPSPRVRFAGSAAWRSWSNAGPGAFDTWRDRKSTRLNSSRSQISNAVFCLQAKTSRTRSRHSRFQRP